MEQPAADNPASSEAQDTEKTEDAPAIEESDQGESASADSSQSTLDDPQDPAENQPDRTPQIDLGVFDLSQHQPRPASQWDLQNPDEIVELFTLAAQANLQTPGRIGCRMELPSQGRLLMTGDLHDHSPNLAKILTLADLDADENHHLILHEVVHGKRLVADCDVSIRTLAQVAALKLAHPNQLHLMMGNHEWAQYMTSGILKGGKDVVEAFTRGVEFLFHDQAPRINEAMNVFIRSLLLAVRCDNGVFCCHSLPSPRWIDAFDDSIIDRTPTDADMLRRGPVYAMIWGRKHDDYVAEELMDAWDVDLFLMGHQRAEMGYDIESPNMLVLASDHEHGMAVPIDLTKIDYTMDDLLEVMTPLASIE